MRKKTILMGVGAILAVVATAWADTTTASFDIQNLEVRGTSGDLAIEVWPASGQITNWAVNSSANYKGCTSTGRWLIYPTASAANRSEVAKMLTGAFLAGKKVKLSVSSLICSGSGTSGYPVFFGVQIQP